MERKSESKSVVERKSNHKSGSKSGRNSERKPERTRERKIVWWQRLIVVVSCKSWWCMAVLSWWNVNRNVNRNLNWDVNRNVIRNVNRNVNRLPGFREDNQTVVFRGSKSRNKVSVGEPVEGSLSVCLAYAR